MFPSLSGCRVHSKDDDQVTMGGRPGSPTFICHVHTGGALFLVDVDLPNEVGMISFTEMLEAVERQSEMLRSVSEVRLAIEQTLEGLRDYRLLLEHCHEKQFQSIDEALNYVDRVLMPQLSSIHDSLETSMQTSLQKLDQASAHTKRLVTKLRTFADGAPDLLP